MSKKPILKAATASKTKSKPDTSVKAVKASMTPRKAPAALSAGLVMPKGAPAAETLSAPAPIPEIQEKAQEIAVTIKEKRTRNRIDARTEPHKNLGFNVPVSFVEEFQAYSLERGTKLNRTLFDAFKALREKESL